MSTTPNTPDTPEWLRKLSGLPGIVGPSAAGLRAAADKLDRLRAENEALKRELLQKTQPFVCPEKDHNP